MLKLEAQFFGNDLAAGQNCNVLQHRLAAVAKTGRLDRAAFQDAAQMIDDQGRQRLAFDVFCDDQQGLPAFGDLFEQTAACRSAS